MVTSNKLPEKKVVKMTEQNNSVVVPQRTLLGEVNEHITCPLCRGYYIDATTIVECLHSFCRSCIIKHLQVKSYCPVCEMMINSAKPNIKLDKALQDIVYKLVPGLFQKEMERRQQFYASRPGPAASATPEQRGEDTERIIFSPEDVISFSLEYADATDTDSISSKSSDSNDPQPMSGITRRYLQCPAVVNISHLKKFLSMKFDIDNSQFAIDILYKRVPLPDYYTLMDIAYIYNWKRNEPMRFFYQIIDYIAIRNRLFDINRKGSHFQDRKPSPASTEDTNASSPAPNLNDHTSEISSGTDSPMPDENNSKHTSENSKSNDKLEGQSNASGTQDNTKPNKTSPLQSKKTEEEVKKSQFLNSFELTAKSNNLPVSASSTIKSSPTKPSSNDKPLIASESSSKILSATAKTDDTLKRKHMPSPNIPEMKKLKIELEKTKLTNLIKVSNTANTVVTPPQSSKPIEVPGKPKDNESSTTNTSIPSTNNTTLLAKDVKPQMTPPKQQLPESPGAKRPIPGSTNMMSPKRKTANETFTMHPPSASQKTLSPLKPPLPKLETSSTVTKPIDVPKPTVSKTIDASKPALKKIPDLKPSGPSNQISLNRGLINKVRMDLLANNSDPTIDRSKILSQVKSSMSAQNSGQATGDPLKTLFDSCKINIPSSLSITLTDQKLDPRNPESLHVDPKKNLLNKNLSGASAATHKVPTPPVHNYIEILKIPDTESKKQNKPEGSTESVASTLNKIEAITPQQKTSNKTPETSAKGPVPNLKPIADTKLGKQAAGFSAPITFQQTFEQQLQALQSDKKPKLPKNKGVVPKLVPATPKAFSAAVNKLNSSNNKPCNQGGMLPNLDNKPSTALDLSTPHNIQSHLSPHQTKTFEAMQSIANLAKKQNLTAKGTSQSLAQSFTNRPLPTSVGPMRMPSSGNQIKLNQPSQSGLSTNIQRQDMANKTNQMKLANNPSPTTSPGYQVSHNSQTTAQPSPRLTRSPSSSPKLVIAEEKQISNNPAEQNINQSNQITSTQLSSSNAPKSESPKTAPGPSQIPSLKPPNKFTGLIRQPMPPTLKPNPIPPTDYQMIAAQALLRQQMEVSAWFRAQSHSVFKNMTIGHQNQKDFNKDKK